MCVTVLFDPCFEGVLKVLSRWKGKHWSIVSYHSGRTEFNNAHDKQARSRQVLTGLAMVGKTTSGTPQALLQYI